MKIHPRPSERGIALIIVLIVVFVLIGLAGTFAYLMKVETTLARNAAFEPDIEWMGRSGVELARYVLAQSGKGPQGQFDALSQVWAGGPGDTNDAVSQIPLKDYPIGRGSISVDIKDLDRKFNINVADAVIIKQALTLVGVDASSFDTIADSILDWRDPDDDTHLSGTESDHYKNMTPPYFAKNGPIDDITELMAINGVTYAMFTGVGGEGEAVPRRTRLGRNDDRFGAVTYSVGLKDLFTALSGQRVNINTASAMVLQLMPEIDETIAASIISGPLGRAGPDGSDGTLDDQPFRNVSEVIMRVPGMQAAGPEAAQRLNQYFSVRSAVFEVTVDVTVGSLKRQYVALLRRGGNAADVKLLYMYWK